jgi:hypothetical protein
VCAELTALQIHRLRLLAAVRMLPTWLHASVEVYADAGSIHAAMPHLQPHTSAPGLVSCGAGFRQVLGQVGPGLALGSCRQGWVKKAGVGQLDR